MEKALATAFSSSEVKALIRALFQNTERRAATLAKIKQLHLPEKAGLDQVDSSLA